MSDMSEEERVKMAKTDIETNNSVIKRNFGNDAIAKLANETCTNCKDIAPDEAEKLFHEECEDNSYTENDIDNLEQITAPPPHYKFLANNTEGKITTIPR